MEDSRQVSLFNQAAEREAADAGIASATEHAGKEWIDHAYDAAVAVLERKGWVTSTAAREELLSRGHPDAPEPRAWGGVIRRLRRKLKLRKMGEMGAGSHGRPVAVWGYSNPWHQVFGHAPWLWSKDERS